MTESRIAGMVDSTVRGMKEKPGQVIELEVSSDQFEGLMNEAVGLAEEKYPGLKIDSQLKLHIFRSKCVITGKISANHPVLGHNEANAQKIQIENSVTPGLLVVKDPRIEKTLSTQSKLLAFGAGLDVDREIGKVLENPNQALQNLMKSQLAKQGIQLHQIGLRLVDDKLSMSISGAPSRS